jgi:hypothetical protein
MNRILASVLVTINALLGFVLIMGSIAFAKFAFERIYSGQLPPEVFPYANMIRYWRTRIRNSVGGVSLWDDSHFGAYRKPSKGH